MLQKICVQWQKSRSESCDFTKNTIFDKKRWQETEWTEILRTESVLCKILQHLARVNTSSLIHACVILLKWLDLFLLDFPDLRF